MDLLKEMAERAERIMDEEEREATFRKDWGMSDPNAETVQNFLKGLNARIILLEEPVDRCAGLLGLGPPAAKEERKKDEPIGKRPGTIGSIQDNIKGMTRKVRDLALRMGDILDELERI